MQHMEEPEARRVWVGASGVACECASWNREHPAGRSTTDLRVARRPTRSPRVLSHPYRALYNVGTHHSSK